MRGQVCRGSRREAVSVRVVETTVCPTGASVTTRSSPSALTVVRCTARMVPSGFSAVTVVALEPSASAS